MKLPIVAVTGATGFIGRGVVRALVDFGYDVRALARRLPEGQPGEYAKSVSWVLGSLSDRDALAALIKNVVAVVHCAGAVKAAGRDEFFAVNRDGTRALAELAAAAPVPPRFILVSSLAAREPRLSAYAASKRAGEQAVRALRPRLPAIILRPPAVYGPGDMETLRVFRMAAKGFVLAPMVAGARASLAHVNDVVAAVMAALAFDDVPDRPIEFDDGTPGAHSWAEIAAAAGAALGTKPRLIAVPSPVVYLAGAAASLLSAMTREPQVLSWGKVSELLHPDWVADPADFPGYNPLWDIDKGFKDAVRWYTSRGLLTS